MKKHELIAKIMSTQTFAIQEGQKLSDVRKLMADKGIHHVPIVQGKKLSGLISATDLMKINLVINGADERAVDTIIDQQFTIADIMTTQLTTIQVNDTIRHAAEILANGAFHSLPVVDDDGHLAGIITSTDLIRYLSDQY